MVNQSGDIQRYAQVLLAALEFSYSFFCSFHVLNSERILLSNSARILISNMKEQL